MLFSKSTWLHLRIPFSIFLLPVFLFALSTSNIPDWGNVPLVFFIIHFLLYPASNAFNSYFDKDEGSIGALRNPPKVEKELYYAALILDGFALVLSIFVGWEFALLVFVYGLASKAYSHPSIRLKRYPFQSWLIAGFFQGFVAFMACLIGISGSGFDIFDEKQYLIPAALSSLLLWGSYPMTQIYQHEEDARRGDITLSLKLGIKGTFRFTLVFFMISTIGFYFYLNGYHSLFSAYVFLASLVPLIGYFLWWYWQTSRNSQNANYRNTMTLNWISSAVFSSFFIWLKMNESL